MLAKLTHALLLLTLFYPMRWLVGCLSWRQALRIANGLARLHACWHRDQLQRQVCHGIRAVWGDGLTESALRQLVRRNLVTRYKHLVDGFCYRRLDATVIEQLVPMVDGQAHLDEALSGGRGAILLVAHFGSFGLLIGGLALRGYQLQQIFTLTPPSQFRSWRWVEDAIMAAKLRCWEHEVARFDFWQPGMYLRPLYRQLLAGAIVVLYGDGMRGQRPIQSTFMGHPMAFATGPFRIAARARVDLIPAFIIRGGDDRHRLVLEYPITVTADDPITLQHAVDRYAAVLGHYVRAYPDQWFSWARLRGVVKDGQRCLGFVPNEMEVYDPQARG